MTLRCEWCGSDHESPSREIAQVIHCCHCGAPTWHYKSERYDELRDMDSHALARLLMAGATHPRGRGT